MSDPKLTGKAKAIGLRWLEDSSLENWFPFSAEELVRLKAEREELRKALSDLLLVAEYKDMKSGESVGSLFPLRFDKARAVLAKLADSDDVAKGKA